MLFKNIAILASAALVSADNVVTFRSMDKIDRTVIWTGSSTIPTTSVPAGQNVTVAVPQGYIGNAYSVSSGATNKPGMLAEFAFNSFAGATYFDVSAIVDPNDKTGVYQMYPADTKSPISGCKTFACGNAYYLPDDIQTKSTTSNHIIVTLGAGPLDVSELKQRDVENFPREAVMDPHFKPALKQRFTSALRWARRG